MQTKELYSFVEKELAKGVDEATIKNQLTQEGAWEEKYIKKAFSNAYFKIPTHIFPIVFFASLLLLLVLGVETTPGSPNGSPGIDVLFGLLAMFVGALGLFASTMSIQDLFLKNKILPVKLIPWAITIGIILWLNYGKPSEGVAETFLGILLVGLVVFSFIMVTHHLASVKNLGARIFSWFNILIMIIITAPLIYFSLIVPFLKYSFI